jgi:hypothetical protein
VEFFGKPIAPVGGLGLPPFIYYRRPPTGKGLNINILMEKTNTKLFSQANPPTNCVHRVY